MPKQLNDHGARYVFVSFMMCDGWFPTDVVLDARWMVSYVSIVQNHSGLITTTASPKSMDHGIKNKSIINVSNDKARR